MSTTTNTVLYINQVPPIMIDTPIAPSIKNANKSLTRKIYDKESGEIFAEVDRDKSYGQHSNLADGLAIT